MAAALTIGPWGGKGGIAFDDGCCNGGVTALNIYYSDTILLGFHVFYGDGTNKVHGGSTGGHVAYNDDFSASKSLENVGVYVAANPIFTGDPSRAGVVSLGLSAWVPAPGPFPLPAAAKVTEYRPQILGFFGRASATGVDSLGFYLSNPTHE